MQNKDKIRRRFNIALNNGLIDDACKQTRRSFAPDIADIRATSHAPIGVIELLAVVYQHLLAFLAQLCAILL